MRHLLSISLLVVIAVAGGGCCNIVPRHDAGWYYVAGEVQFPTKLIPEGRITLLQVIASSGSFTPSANKKKVRVTRYDGERLIIDCTSAERDPQLDVPIYPGDHIYVPRISKWPLW
jgi:protein involved in polysaccharide export with SLBB domain